jgi:hypothetical protein
MIKKLIAVAMLIATLSLGVVAHAQATGGSSGRHADRGKRGRHLRYRRHRRGRKRSRRNLNPQPLPPE